MANNQSTTAPANAGRKKSLNDIQVPNWVAAVIIIAMVAAVALFFFLSRRAGESEPALAAAAPQTQLAQEASPDAQEVEVLPNTARSFDGGDVKNPFASETLGNIRVTGIISNSSGKFTAILESDSSSYVVGAGDTMPESSWSVSEISENSVILTNGATQKTIYMQTQSQSTGVK